MVGCGSSHRLQDCNKRAMMAAEATITCMAAAALEHRQPARWAAPSQCEYHGPVVHESFLEGYRSVSFHSSIDTGLSIIAPSNTASQPELPLLMFQSCCGHAGDGCFRSVPLYLSIQSSFNVGDPGSSSTCSRNSRRRLAWALNGSSEVRQHQLRQVPAQAAATGLVKVLLEYTRLTEFQVPSMRGQTAISPSWQRYKAESPQTAAPPEWLAQVLFR